MNPVDLQNSHAGGLGDDDQASFAAGVRQEAWPCGSLTGMGQAMSAMRGAGILILAVIFLAGLHAAEPATATPQPPILSGCEYDYPPYYVAKDGKADGFSVELLRAALTAVGQTVSFKVADVDEIKQDLAAGRLQVLSMVNRTSEREALYDFTSPYLTMHGCIVVREDNADIHSTADLRGRQVATAREKYAEDYLRRANLGAVIVPLPSFAAALQELSGGKHDAVIVQKMVALRFMRQAGIHNLRIIDPPIPDFLQAICFAVSKGDSARLALLNEGLAIVMADGTYQQLYTKWFSVIAMAARSRPLIVGSGLDFQPFTLGQTDATADGFAVALWKAVAKEQGLPFQMRVRPWGQLLEEFKAGQVDVLVCAASSDERRQFARFSVVHSTDSGALFVRTDDTHIRSEADLVGKSIIVVKGDLAHEYSIAHGWQQQLVLVDQVADGFRLLASGQHDAVLISRIVGAQTLKKLAITTVQALPAKAGAGRAFSFAVQRDDVDLLATLNEGLAVCKANGTYDAIYDQWLRVYDEKDLSLLMVMRHIWPYMAVSLIAFLGLVIGLQYRRQTERKNADAALAASEAQLRHLMQNLRVGIVVHGPDTRILLHNQTALALLGFSGEQMLGKVALDLAWCFVREDKTPMPVVEYPVMRVIATREPVHDLVLGILRPLTGDCAWVLVNAFPEFASNGQLQQVVVAFADITARKQAEAALRELAETQTNILNALPAHIALLDPQGVILAVNDSWRRFGSANALQSMDFFVGRNYLQVCESAAGDCSQEARQVAEGLRAVLGGTRRDFSIEYPCHSPGEKRWFRLMVTPLQHERLAGVVVMHVNVSERRLGEEKLRESETRWRFAIEGAGDGVWDWDVPTSSVYFSPRWKQMLGYADDEIGNDLSEWSSRVHPDDLPGAMADLKKHLDGHTPSYVNEHRVRCKDGSYKWILDRGLVMSRDAAGRPQRVVGTHNDITERKLAESAIKDSETRFRALFDNATESIITMDEAGMVLSVNRSAETVFGYTAQELIGTRLEAILPTPHREQHQGYLRRYLDTGEKRIIGIGRVVEALRKDGSRITLHLSISVASTGQQRIFMGMLRDLTAELQAAEAKKQLEAQLFQAMKMSALGTLVSGVAHEINNPANFISLNTPLLLRLWHGVLPTLDAHAAAHSDFAVGTMAWSEVRALVPQCHDGIQEGVRRIKRIVTDLKDFAREDTPGFADTVDLNAVVATAVRLVEHTVRKWTHTLRLELGDGLPALSGSHQRLEQVVINLLINACHALPRHDCAIRVRTRYDTAALAVVLEVEDEGIGIPTEVLQRITEPFFTTKRDIGGTGLGLSVSAAIIAEHGGTMTFVSQVGSGTTARITLPVERQPG